MLFDNNNLIDRYHDMATLGSFSATGITTLAGLKRTGKRTEQLKTDNENEIRRSNIL
ncbi:MAG: hypothetical protein R2744_11505 [Bacteroidales bacterium]